MVDFTGLFLGFPEQDGSPCQFVGDALLYLGLLAVVVALVITASEGRRDAAPGRLTCPFDYPGP